jgi:hypothetical protein
MAETKGNALTGVRCTIEPGSGNYHLRLAGCDDCNVREFSRKSLGQIEDLYQAGYIRQAMFEAYMHVWATSATHSSSVGDGWTTPATNPEVIALVDLFQKALAERKAEREAVHHG